MTRSGSAPTQFWSLNAELNSEIRQPYRYGTTNVGTLSRQFMKVQSETACRIWVCNNFPSNLVEICNCITQTHHVVVNTTGLCLGYSIKQLDYRL